MSWYWIVIIVYLGFGAISWMSEMIQARRDGDYFGEISIFCFQNTILDSIDRFLCKIVGFVIYIVFWLPIAINSD
ncbi:hypothetical protein A2V71_00280 [Candidatus Berkelbacteria bacterium RBG_13_40_8]|uniref:Uncharacterized protein n=1 Tax=Candidatus Berkelbacteria bacterium RBG_13_40_8 TaxID=1797467 RepID=A0A1F5DPS3_9BACT|nr:MAG: hypothetical protein A2V71_00280 [Candidatus Berkelbacteria bacterium RBG_13_40_8]